MHDMEGDGETRHTKAIREKSTAHFRKYEKD